MFGQHGVDQGAIAVDCAVEIAPTAANLQIRFIDVQGLSSSAGPTTPPLSHLMGQNGCELRLPLMDSLVAKDDAALEEHVGEVLQRASIAQRKRQSTTSAITSLGYWVRFSTPPLLSLNCRPQSRQRDRR